MKETSNNTGYFSIASKYTPIKNENVFNQTGFIFNNITGGYEKQAYVQHQQRVYNHPPTTKVFYNQNLQNAPQQQQVAYNYPPTNPHTNVVSNNVPIKLTKPPFFNDKEIEQIMKREEQSIIIESIIQGFIKNFSTDFVEFKEVNKKLKNNITRNLLPEFNRVDKNFPKKNEEKLYVFRDQQKKALYNNQELDTTTEFEQGKEGHIYYDPFGCCFPKSPNKKIEPTRGIRLLLRTAELGE